MSRVLKARKLIRSGALLLHPGAAAEILVPPTRSPPLSVLTPCVGSGAWLPACFARGSFAASSLHQRGVATASGGEPPSRGGPPDGSSAPTRPASVNQSSSAADGRQRRGLPQDGGSGGGGASAQSDSAARGGESQELRQAGGRPLEATPSIDRDGQLPPGDGAGAADGGAGEGPQLSLALTRRQPEGEIDELLDAWDPLMAEEELDIDAIFEVMERHMGDSVLGMPPAQSVLEGGDEDEMREKELRRAREEALKQEFAAKRIRIVDQLGRSYATGKRKCSIARVWVMPGSGQIRVNKRRMTEYFPALVRRMDVLKPFEVTGTLGHFDVMSTITGGGSTGQAQALRHGIARALQCFDPALRPVLKTEGLLTRDSRIVERKKPGLAKARKAFQWVKR